MQKTFILFTLISSFLFQTGFAAEIDSVTPRKLKLENSLTMINTIVNQRLQQGIQKANSRQAYIQGIDAGNFCDQEVLYSELRKAIFQSFTASWGLKGYALDQQLRRLLARQSYSLSLNDSIYRDINYIEGFSLNLKELSDVININGHLVGIDKVGHFFAQGWQYFELTQFEGQNINQALERGRQQEAGKFGYSTTGIFSFADLVSNFNGWRFWNKILVKQDDPLKGALANFFNRPYVSCEIQFMASIKNKKITKAWQFNSQFNLSDYIDGAWDEANNCNSFADPIIEQKVTLRIKNVDPDFSCPYITKHCVEAKDKYGDYAKYVLHPSCLIVTKE
jgi:hypothetical protein